MKAGNIKEKPPKIKPGFLRRALTVYDGDEIVLKKVRLKKLFISQIHEKEPEGNLTYDLRKHKYIKKKTLCGLKYVQLGSLRNLYWFNELKNAQNLKTINDEKEKNKKLREEIAPFYNFHLFPNTKCLNLLLFSDCLYPLGPFVIDGFVSLKKLERLNLQLDARSVGTKVFFHFCIFLYSIFFSWEFLSLETTNGNFWINFSRSKRDLFP